MIYDAKEIGKRILALRLQKKYTQKQLGEKLGVSGKQISNYENGTPIPPIDMLLSLCNEFDCELGFLLGEETYSAGTSLKTAIGNFLGLDTDSIDRIRHITGDTKDCVEFGHLSNEYRSALNHVLHSQRFAEIIEQFVELERIHSLINKISDDFSSTLSEEEERTLLYCMITPENERNDSSINAEKAKLVLQKYDKLSVESEKLDFQEKVIKYELGSLFQRLLSDFLYLCGRNKD